MGFLPFKQSLSWCGRQYNWARFRRTRKVIRRARLRVRFGESFDESRAS
jgi:hypothetical protein